MSGGLRIDFWNGKHVILPANVLVAAQAAKRRTLSGQSSWVSEFLRKNSPVNNYAFLRGESSMRQYCLRNLQRKLQGQYVSFFEALAGAGLTARGIFETDPHRTYLNDYDTSCVQILQANWDPWNVVQADMGNDEERERLFRKCDKVDLWFLDFNNYTTHKFHTNFRVFGRVGYGDFVRHVFNSASRYTILNDCSVMMLNKKRTNALRTDQPPISGYQLVSRFLPRPVQSMAEYWPALQDYYHTQFPDWWLTDVEVFSASSYTLFRKQATKPDELVIHKNTPEDLKRDPIIKAVIEI